MDFGLSVSIEFGLAGLRPLEVVCCGIVRAAGARVTYSLRRRLCGPASYHRGLHAFSRRAACGVTAHSAGLTFEGHGKVDSLP